MSVLIKGMKMPTCCADCDLHNPFSETPYCRRLLRRVPLEGRPENCPLVEVPPSADDVAVVRCKFCKHRDTEKGFCEGRGWPMQLVPDDGFCDKGERRCTDGT